MRNLQKFLSVCVRRLLYRWMSACTSMIEIHLINHGFLPEEQIWTFSSGIDIKNIWRKLNIGIQGLPQRWIRFLTRSSICSEIRKVKNLFSAADWCWAMSNPAKPQITPQSATKLLILDTELLLFLQE